MNFLKNTYYAAKANDLDLVYTNYFDFTGTTQDNSFRTTLMPCKYDANKYNRIFSGNDDFALREFIHRWQTLHRRSLIADNKIFHLEELSSCEDVSFFKETTLLAKRIMCLQYVGVFHRTDNSNSITKNVEGLCKNFFRSHEYLKDRLIERGLWEENKGSFLGRCIGNLDFALKKLPFDEHIPFILNYQKHLKRLIEDIGDIDEIDQTKMPFTGAYEILLKAIYTPMDYYAGWLAYNFKISVIMPIHNAEKTLRNTLNSLISQTLKEIEIILIDDGSTDESLSIMKEYAKLDSRIMIFEQENLGFNTARNLGIEQAHGLFLSFLNVYDRLYPNMLDETYHKALYFEADVVWFMCEELDKQKNIVKALTNYFAKNGTNFPDNDTFNFSELKNNPFMQINGGIYDKIFRRSFILKNNIRFSTTCIDEDIVFTSIAMMKANKIKSVDQVLLTRLIEPDINISKNLHDNKYFNIFYKNYLKLQKGISSTAPNLLKDFVIKVLHDIHHQFCNIVTTDENAEIVFDNLADGFLENIGFNELVENDFTGESKEIYAFFSRLIEYRKGEFTQFKESLVEYPITVAKNEKTERELSFVPGRKTNAKIIFQQSAEIGKNTAAPFFSFNVEELEHRSIIAQIEFTYLDNNKPCIYDTLYFGAYVRTINNSPTLIVYQAQWKHGRKIFIDNIYYTINGSSITFHCQYTEQYTGFEYRLLSLTSRAGDDNTTILSLISKNDLNAKMPTLPKNAIAITENVEMDTPKESTLNTVQMTELMDIIKRLAQIFNDVDSLKLQNNQLADRLLKLENILKKPSRKTEK